MIRWLAQVAPDRTPAEAMLDTLVKLWLPISVLLLGVSIAVGVIWVLRGRQTPPTQMPRGQRWLVVCLLGLVAGLGVIGILQAVL